MVLVCPVLLLCLIATLTKWHRHIMLCTIKLPCFWAWGQRPSHFHYVVLQSNGHSVVSSCHFVLELLQSLLWKVHNVYFIDHLFPQTLVTVSLITFLDLKFCCASWTKYDKTFFLWKQEVKIKMEMECQWLSDETKLWRFVEKCTWFGCGPVSLPGLMLANGDLIGVRATYGQHQPREHLPMGYSHQDRRGVVCDRRLFLLFSFSLLLQFCCHKQQAQMIFDFT